MANTKQNTKQNQKSNGNQTPLGFYETRVSKDGQTEYLSVSFDRKELKEYCENNEYNRVFLSAFATKFPSKFSKEQKIINDNRESFERWKASVQNKTSSEPIEVTSDDVQKEEENL